MSKMDFLPTFIWTSNTERAYETASIIAREFQLGQNRIVPEYSFLDARAVGAFEDKNDEASWKVCVIIGFLRYYSFICPNCTVADPRAGLYSGHPVQAPRGQ
jgi:hypothetical protein